MDEFYLKIGAMFQEKRKANKLTQEAVAESLGINRATLANLEAGEHRLLLHHAIELCSLLGIEPNDVVKEYEHVKLRKAIDNQSNRTKSAIEKSISGEAE